MTEEYHRGCEGAPESQEPRQERTESGTRSEPERNRNNGSSINTVEGTDGP
jgi:hypothetical protein